MSATARPIVSEGYDRLWFGWGAAAASLSFVGLHHALGSGATLALYVAFNALYNLPHQYCTWFRALTHPEAGRRRRWGLTWVMLASILSLAALAPAAVTEAVFTNALPYWGIWHLIAQHFGISQILRARGGEGPGRLGAAGSRRWTQAFFIGIFGLGVLRSHAATDLTFRVGDTGSAMLRLPFPEAYAGAMTAALAVIYVALCAARLWPAWRVNRARFGFEALVAGATFVAFFGCDDVMITTAAITSLHNIHYIGLVRYWARSRHAQDAAERPLSRRDLALAYAYSISVHGVFLISALAGQVVLASLVALHYVVDGQIWRVGADRRLARQLALVSGVAPAAVGPPGEEGGA